MTQVLLLTNSITPDKLGGSYRYVRELADGLAEAGADVIVATKRLNPGDPETERTPAGALLIRHAIPPRSSKLYVMSYPLAVARGVAGTVRAYPDALVHVHYPVPALAVALGRRPFVSTFHAPIHKELLSERQGTWALPSIAATPAVQAAKQVERLVASRARENIVLSEFTRGLLSELSARAGARAHVVPGGIDTRRFVPGQQVEPGPWPRLFTARRLVPRTGVGELVAAMPAVVERFPDARLRIAGSGTLQGAIEQQISDLGLTNNIELLGRIFDDELVREYQQASLVVLPTQELEGFGLTTAEALACGAPVLGTPAGATPEILAQIDPLLVADGITATDISRAMLALLGDRERLARLAQASRARVEPAFSWKTVVERHLEIYEAVRASAARAR